MRPLILVTGASGKTGSAVTERLLAKGFNVRALVRKNDSRSDRLKQLGAEIVVADLFDYESVAKALAGVKRAYFVPAFDPFVLQSATVFAVAAREAKLEYLIQMSQWIANPSHPSHITRQIWLIDQLFSQIPNVAHTIVNPGMFADNFLRLIDFATLLGVYPVLTGLSKSAPISNEDIAKVVAHCLADPDGHAGKTYHLTGPRLLDGYEMASAIAKVSGRRVTPIAMPFWLFAKAARIQGVNSYEVGSYLDYVTDHRKGFFELDDGVTDVMENVTGEKPEPFETTVSRYLNAPFARRTGRNIVKAWLSFLATPLVLGHNFDRQSRRLGIPVPRSVAYSSESGFWKGEHQRGSRLNSPTASLAGRHRA